MDATVPSERTVFRASTYEIIATGSCINCRESSRPLRFLFNPFGDDFLLCFNCADRMDEILNDDVRTL